MSSFNDKLFEKIKTMESREAFESLLSILLTSNEWKERSKATELLLAYEDVSHFKQVKGAYLNEIHPTTRINLIKLLVKNYEIEGVSFLMEQYNNENDWKVRKSIIENVGSIKKEEAVHFLLEAMQDNDLEIKKTAIIYLSKIGTLPNNALIPLFEQLKFRNVEINDLLINLIVKIAKKGKIQDILEFKKEGNININRSIPIILGKIGTKEIKEYIIDFLNDKNDIVRKNAIIALKNLINSDDVSHLIEMLNDPNSAVRETVINVLGSVESEKTIKPLFELLKTEEDKLQKVILKSLAKISENLKSLNIIHNLAKKGNVNVRRGAAKVIGKLGRSESIDVLINLLNSKNSRIRSATVSSIIKIYKKHEEVKDNLLIALNSREWQIRKYVARILGVIKDEDTILSLFNLLKDTKSGVRKAATSSLAKFKKKKIIELAKNYINNEDWKSKRSAVNLLIKIGNDESLELLIPCLNDEDPYIKGWAAKGLGKLKNLKDIEPLLIMLNDNNSMLRLSAAKALGDIGNNKALKPLIERLGDDDWKIRKEVEHSLNKIDPNWMNTL